MPFLEETYNFFLNAALNPEEKVRRTLLKFLEDNLDRHLYKLLVEDQNRDIVIRRKTDGRDIFVIEIKRRGYYIYRNADVYDQLQRYLRRKYPPYHGALFNLDKLILLSHPSREQYPLGRRLDSIEKLIIAIHDAANEETVPINNARRR